MLQYNINMNKQTETIQQQVSELVQGDVTPYKLSKLASQIMGREMRPQQLYNYCSNRLIKSQKVDGKLTIKREDAVAWLVKYATKHLAS